MSEQRTTASGRATRRTAEPEGSVRPGSARATGASRRSGTAPSRRVAQRAGNAPIFVVHQHAARRLHYDVRLEAGGVLKSWAVPKGPSADPGVKRLAVRTEDHPVEYAEFEGVIPAGEYGGGEVIVWDTGTYRNLTERRGEPVPVADAVARGHVAVWLDGQKLGGGYAFTRLPARPQDRGSGDSWLMVKMRDDAVTQLASSHAIETGASVRTGRTLADVAADPTAKGWRSKRTNDTSRGAASNGTASGTRGGGTVALR